ncbi:MAG: site-2 protease family protein [Myxococcaceae bacterium]
MPSAIFRPGDRPLLHLGLLSATLVSIFGTFLFIFGGASEGGLTERALGSLVFTLTLVTILGTHEMGHYLLARHHGVDTSLPYFIPFPVLGVGTLGAVIRIRSRIPTKNALVDIGAAGPLAGLLVALPVLVWGFAHAQVVDVPHAPARFPGENSLWVLLPELARYLMALLTGAALAPEAPGRLVFGDNLLTLGLQWLFFGPLPPGREVVVPPIFIAGWFGLLVTMLNLVPIGQTDGGHLTHAIFGDRAPLIGKLMTALMAAGALLFSASWVVWMLITAAVIGFRHPAVVLPEEPLSPGRKLICLLCLIAFIICVMPVPLSQVSIK